jgi:hypothetical protein
VAGDKCAPDIYLNSKLLVMLIYDRQRFIDQNAEKPAAERSFACEARRILECSQAASLYRSRSQFGAAEDQFSDVMKSSMAAQKPFVNPVRLFSGFQRRCNKSTSIKVPKRTFSGQCKSIRFRETESYAKTAALMMRLGL